ncbi:MAG: EAL domain-containing protein [Treponema sp.]|uniref:EAL domain-containing protein n=1 Tax=Treponema sp. TaxID=166 RepID=UPI0025E1FA73|nr:EAL domain-containing protein [Treponema sp.]MBQ9281347.1 EAL domain-containing protein [Treponema sp.]
MWNYSFILPDFIILFTFWVYYFAHPRLPIKLNRRFLFILIVNIITVTSDVVSSLALENASYFSYCALRIFNTIFFFFFILRSLCFFLFTEDVLDLHSKRKSLLSLVKHFVFIFSELIALSNLFFDTIFSISATCIYTRGSFYNLIYICAFYYLALAFLQILFHRKKVDSPLFVALLSFNLVLSVGYIFRILFPQYLVMNFFALLSIIIIFITFENPIYFLSSKAKAFNKSALHVILKEYECKRNPLVLAFVIRNYNELREIYSPAQMDRGISLISLFLMKKYPRLLRFYLRDGRFVLVGQDNSKSDKIREEISMRFSHGWRAGFDVDLYLEPKFVQFADGIDFSNSKKISSALFAAFKEAESLESVNILITDETLKGIEETTRIKRAVEYAVENNSVEMFLQPLMDSNDYRLVGAEALARIRDENGNLIPPGLFIPIAEKNGRINSMGEQMFEKACEFIHNHDIEKIGISWINVNLSPIQFLRPDLNKRFSQILGKYKVPAEKIHLEITEESMIDYALLQKQIQSMRSSGFQFVLDDYGSGYSNMSRLKKCPFINIKLDMGIVRDYFKDRDKILPSLVQAFKQMNFTVTAEGVENLEMVEIMKKIGCDFLQGFYFSKPLPAEEFAKVYG